MKKEKGITLIALVVTIVVLLILAGVSISMITGENGIITQAQDTKLVTERASLREKLQLDAVAETDKDSLEVFKNLGYIVGENNQVKVEAIPDLQLTTGKGTNGKDIYTIEIQENKYQLIYTDKNENRIEVGEVGQVGKENPFSYTQADIDETLKYFKWVVVEVTEKLKEERGYSDDTVGKKVAIIYDTVESYYIYGKGGTFPIKKIVIPEKIEDSDFVDILDTYKNMENGASTISILDNLETIIYLNDYNIFNTTYCKDLKNIKFPKNITSIPYSAFAGCRNLTDITISEDVTNIGEKAFYNCNNLTNVTIPNSVTTIEYGAFSGCSNLRTVNYKGTREQWEAITIDEGNSYLTNASINYNYTGK